jgi:DNA-binding LacI/PurR family transcriptional regulator
MRDVARLAGVSLQTVSNVVHGRHDEMSPATRDRVIAAMDQLGYRTNVAAASLRSQRVRTIAVLVLDEHAEFLTDPLMDLLIAGVGDVARDHSYGVLIQGARPGRRDAAFFRCVREGRADGAVIQLSGPPGLRREVIDEARALGVSVLVIDETDLPPDVMGVRAEQERGARQLTEHLLARGHRRIAFIGARMPWAVVEQRVAGFRAALRAHGLPLDEHPVLLEAGLEPGDGETLATGLLAGPDRPTAIMCSSDLLAAGALQGARTLGLRVPSDVAITGFENLSFAPFLDPPLTSVRVPAYEMGRRAASALITQLEGREVVQREIVLPVDLVLRGST